jgi:hypothetical protein
MPNLEKEVVELRAKLTAFELERSIRQMVEQSNVALLAKLETSKRGEKLMTNNAHYWKTECLLVQEELSKYKRGAAPIYEGGY